MILARKLQSAVRLYRRGGLSTVAELVWDQSRGYLEANAILPCSVKRQAALMTRVFNERAEYSFLAFDQADARLCRPLLLLPYLRRQFFDVCECPMAPGELPAAEIAIHADSLFRRWEFQRLDALLPEWRRQLAGTKFAPFLEQLGRRVALRLGRLAEAAAGLAPSGGDVGECRLRAEILDAQGRMAEATQAFTQAVHRQADDPLVRLNFAFHLLKRGRLLEGLENWGLADRLRGSYPLQKRRRQWAGENLEGRSLLVIFEHGFGDMIQFSRFLLPLRKTHPGARIVGRVPGPLVGLLARSFPDVSFVAAEGEEPPYDFYVPSLQLALVLEADSLEPTTGYLTLQGPASAVGERHGATARNRVGICWRGHPREYELTRSIPIESFSQVLSRGDTDFVVLLNKLTPEEDAFLEGFGNVLRPAIRDFADLASLVADCDLVISVDTAVAHVAGAGGKAALLLSRPDSCWRWGYAGSRSQWYSTVEVLRHPGDLDWDVVLAEARRRVQERLCPVPAAALDA